MRCCIERIRRGGVSPPTGRHTGRPLRGCSILCRCTDRIRRGGVSPPGPQGGRPMRAWCGGNRFCPDPLGSLRCAGRGKRDGKPVPYEGVRYCVVVPTEFVGEAFRLPARSAGGQCVQGAEVIVLALTRSVRNIVPIGENGTGNPSPTRVFEIAPMYRQDS